MDQQRITIVPLTTENIKDVNVTNDYFTIFGKLVPSFKDGIWSHGEELFDKPRETCFPDDDLNWQAYIDNNSKALFLAYSDGNCIGQVRIIKDVNRFCYIENIAIIKSARRQGVGKLLLHKAEEWAKAQKLVGLSLEAQDDNLGACRFYLKHGFKLGGMDTYRHYINPNIDTALFWYKPFALSD
ncbi:GNAT family N-acetyltransferase [Gracilibacillus caseinilyticus]|uniref:GNAT family N-acetyltransferase n=1 Tax=Gracilibacillus caseinilyticus TaxID=2932256 RepID=A0ABY4ESL0_9BACI|nr:GNAT family N-acetyltransferase [Gracilibacillus caseinilyticus]UOQ46857.1 GNAT family N-acetyltransferase [Gracilibacillus caseinilyticus]